MSMKIVTDALHAIEANPQIAAEIQRITSSGKGTLADVLAAIIKIVGPFIPMLLSLFGGKIPQPIIDAIVAALQALFPPAPANP